MKDKSHQTTLTGGIKIGIDGGTISLEFGDFEWRDFVTEDEN